MKKRHFILSIATTLVLGAQAQSPNDVLNLLIQKNTISQQEADSLRADAAIKQQETDAKKKSFAVTAGRNLVISGFTQVRYQWLQEKGKVDGFDIRRARIDVKSNINSYWSYRLQADFAGTPKLLDAYTELKINDYVNFTLGQFKVPYSLEGLTSSNKFEFIDGSLVVENLTARNGDVIGNQNGYDAGIQFNGNAIKINDLNLIEYKIGVFNGAGINIGDNLKEKDVAGRLVFHPIKGIDFGGFAYKGYGYYDTKSSTKTKIQAHDRNRYGAELSAEYQGASLRTEFIEGKDGNKLRSGYYISIGYFLIPQKLQVLVKYDTYDPNIDTKVKNDSKAYYTTVVNYNFNAYSHIQFGYTIRKEEVKAKEIKNNLAVIQYQIGF